MNAAGAAATKAASEPRLTRSTSQKTPTAATTDRRMKKPSGCLASACWRRRSRPPIVGVPRFMRTALSHGISLRVFFLTISTPADPLYPDAARAPISRFSRTTSGLKRLRMSMSSAWVSARAAMKMPAKRMRSISGFSSGQISKDLSMSKML